MSLRVLHVVPDTVLDPRHYHLGSTKDIRGRTEYFTTRALPFDELVAPRSRAGVLTQIRRQSLDKYGAIIFEMTLSPRAVFEARYRARRARILTRSHNAELPHRWDLVRAEGLTRDFPKRLGYLARGVAYDYLCGRASHAVLSITEWEAQHYWPRLVGRARSWAVPYFVPESYVRLIPPVSHKVKQCVCIMSTAPNPLILDAAKNFVALVNGLGGACEDWTFVLTGDPKMFPIDAGPRVRWAGFLESPYQILAASQGMALLSDYGYGFKTKILDAVFTKTHVLLSSDLHARQPEILKPYCIPVDIASPASFQNALEMAQRPFLPGNPNSAFRYQAFAALDALMQETGGMASVL